MQLYKQEEEDLKRHAPRLLLLLPLLLMLILPLSRLFRRPRLHPRMPSPPALPILGHLHLISSVPHRSLHRLSLRLGPIFSLSLGSVPCVVACSATAAHEFLKVHDASFSDRPRTKAVSVLTYGSSNFSFAPHGDFWRFTRRLFMLELFSGRSLEQLRPIRRDELRQLLQDLHEKAREGIPVDLGSEMTKMANNVTSRMAVSRRYSETGGEAEEVKRLVMETTELLGKFNLADYVWFCRNLDLQGFGKRLRDLHRRFNERVERIMEEKEEDRRKKRLPEKKEKALKANDLLDTLLDIFEDEGAEIKLTRDNVKALVRDILTGGTDNTSLTVQWAMSELLNNPLAMEKVKAELDANIGNGRVVEEADIPNLPYLRAVVTETLRLHPPTPLVPREATEDCIVEGYAIPAKTRLFVNLWAIGRDPKHWPSPDKFMPERFLDDGGTGSGRDVRGQHIHMMPFGSGRRGCPAMVTGLLVVNSTLAALIQCFEWEVTGGREEVDMAEAPGLTLQRAKPLLCVPVARHLSLLTLS